MRNTRTSIAAAFAAVLALVVPLHSPLANAQPAATPRPTARVIVQLKQGSPTVRKALAAKALAQETVAQDLGERIGVPLVAGRGISDTMQVVRASGLTSEELAALLAGQPDVEFAVPDRRIRRYLVPNDPLYAEGDPSAVGKGPPSGQWYLRAPSAAVQSGINVEPAWDITLGSPSVVVAVLDTGIRFEHPDFGSNILPGYDMIADAAAANDGDGRDADASDPGDWITEAEANDAAGDFYQCTTLNPKTGRYVAEDSSWHGTMTASLIGALTNNGNGMASVSPGARILPVRVLGKCGGFSSDLVAAIRWAAGLSVPRTPANTNRARVINMSLGAEVACDAAYQAAVDDAVAAGITVVVAAGNEAGHGVSRPGSCRGAIAVAGLRHIGSKVGFSNLGPAVTISAPGGNCVNTAPGTACLYPILAASNTGTTTPSTSTYTDSFNISVGTSFAAPLVAGTAALMLSANPALSPWELRQLMQATARPFPTTGAEHNADGTAVAQCTLPQFTASDTPIDQQQCYCTTYTCGAGMLDAGAAVAAAKNGLAVPQVQAQGLWWNMPAGSENGWGLDIAHQGDMIFATWFTYDDSNRPYWLSMTATRTAANVYSGTLYETQGPTFSAFYPTRVTRLAVGQATIAFSSDTTATFTYTVRGTTDTKVVTRQVFGVLPVCAAARGDLAAATNYQDLWWNPAESGWGLNITQQSEVIFIAWFTYDASGNPLWLSGTARRSSGQTWTGSLVRTAGTGYQHPYHASALTMSPVGNFSLSFSDGNHATFGYQFGGVTQVKQITRQVFSGGGTICN